MKNNRPICLIVNISLNANEAQNCIKVSLCYTTEYKYKKFVMNHLASVQAKLYKRIPGNEKKYKKNKVKKNKHNNKPNTHRMS